MTIGQVDPPSLTLPIPLLLVLSALAGLFWALITKRYRLALVGTLFLVGATLVGIGIALLPPGWGPSAFSIAVLSLGLVALVLAGAVTARSLTSSRA